MKRVLIVDDEEEIRGLIKDKLEKNGYQVLTAANGEEALTISKINLPDLILLDIVMPRLDGYSTCTKLKEDSQTKNIPIVFLTGKDLTPEGIMERCKTLGASGYIPKPSTLKELLDKVKEVIG